MTFSIVATDGRGAFGSAISSSSPAVAARCLHLRDGVGAVNSQNITDPRLGTVALDLLAQGRTAGQAVADIVDACPTADFRQLLVLGADGVPAIHSGAQSLGINAQAVGDGVAAAGNMLANAGIPQAMVDAFQEAAGTLEERLLTALQAGVAAGGEAGPLHSAGLSVVSDAGWRITDLRVDWQDEPVQELARVAAVWLPQRDDYVGRGHNPAASPSYGVPGDE